MADSTLDSTGETDPITTLGHGTGALGPSDSSDSGSDVVGGPGMDEGLSDELARRLPTKMAGTAGRDLGDGDLEADSDRAGTGERGSAGLQDVEAADQALSMVPDPEDDEADDNAEGELDDVPVADGAT